MYALDRRRAGNNDEQFLRHLNSPPGVVTSCFPSSQLVAVTLNDELRGQNYKKSS
jgi:hypothetical protein